MCHPPKVRATCFVGLRNSPSYSGPETAHLFFFWGGGGEKAVVVNFPHTTAIKWHLFLPIMGTYYFVYMYFHMRKCGWNHKHAGKYAMLLVLELPWETNMLVF